MTMPFLILAIRATAYGCGFGRYFIFEEEEP